MVKFARIASAAGATALVIATAAFAGGHDGTNPAVKARQAHMQLYAHNIGVLVGMARGERDYDAEAATAAAENLVALSGIDQQGYWVAGTSTEDLDGTRALPAAFENVDDIRALTADLNEAATAMAAAAGDGQAAIGENLRALGGACGACHDKYQQER